MHNCFWTSLDELFKAWRTFGMFHLVSDLISTHRHCRSASGARAARAVETLALLPSTWEVDQLYFHEENIFRHWRLRFIKSKKKSFKNEKSEYGNSFDEFCLWSLISHTCLPTARIKMFWEGIIGNVITVTKFDIGTERRGKWIF